MGFKFQMLMAATIAAAISQISGVEAQKTKKKTDDKEKHSTIEDVKKYTRHLKFHKDGSFRVLQLSDIYVDGNPEHFLNTQALIENLILKEEPDLVVITGDTVKPDSADGYQGHFESALEKLKSAGIPWVQTGGNYIDEMGRVEQLRMDQQYGEDLSWSGYKWNLGSTRVTGSEEQIGYFTSRIPILDHSGHAELMSIYALDTQSMTKCADNLSGQSCLSIQSTAWFEEQQREFSHNNHHRDFIFMHRPIQEFMHLSNLYSITGHKEQAIDCQALNTGMFAIAKDSNKVGWIGAGGDSNNDFSGNYHDIFLSYGRKTGFGGDGDLLRGGRVFHFEKKSHTVMHVSTWITDENGKRNADMKKNPPPSFQITHQMECGVDPFQDILNFISP